MHTGPITAARAARSRLAMTAAIATLSLAAMATSVTGAVFTDTASVGGNAFTTGTVDISTSPASALVSFDNMAPGDVVTAPITVTNDGSLQLRYAVTSTTTEDTLAAQLDLTIKHSVSDCSNAGFDADGTTIYGAAALGSTGGTNVVGDPTQGAQAGDRTLAASASEVLCVQVSLPAGTGNAYQNLTTTATLAFASEQTVNN